MTLTIPTLLSPPPRSFPRFRHRLSSPTPLAIARTRSEPLLVLPPKNTLTKTLALDSANRFGFLSGRRALSSFVVNAESGQRSDGEVDEAERVARGESTMPERFRYLSKEAPDPPIRWPWFVALAFLIYAWRAVIFELSNWKKGALAIFRFMGYLLKFVLALIFHFIGDPISSSIRCIETTMYYVRAFYSGILAYTSVRELTVVIMLASIVLAIGEAVVPNAVSSQPYILTVAGLIGYAAVRGYISEPFMWTLLVGLYAFSSVIKQRDHITSALPVAAVMAAIGEPWVRAVAVASYLALAISQHSKNPPEGKEVEVVTNRRLPMPLVGAALAIGVRLGAKWIGHRHLTWMIV